MASKTPKSAKYRHFTLIVIKRESEKSMIKNCHFSTEKKLLRSEISGINQLKFRGCTKETNVKSMALIMGVKSPIIQKINPYPKETKRSIRGIT